MSAHTPGPWRLNRPHPTKMHEGLYGADGSLITYFKVDISREDARLIAVAPDLYAACKAVFKFLDTPYRSADEDDLYSLLSAALAKAAP